MHNRFSYPVRPGRINSTLLLFCRVCCFIALAPNVYADETPIAALSPYVSNGGYALQIEGKVVRSSNLHKDFIPASTIKVLTALLALDILGPEYRFATRFYRDKDNVLYIQGEGDPFLTSEVIVDIAHRLKGKGLSKFDRIVLDDSAFTLEGPPPGSENSLNPYDAHSNALAVNFNALPFVVNKKGQVRSGEKQTPLLPMMGEFANKFGAGRYRVNVSAIPQSASVNNMLRYTGELFLTIFQNEGIEISGGYQKGRLALAVSPLLVYESDKTVAELVQLCLYYSSNFIANQLYLSCGRRIYGFPATWAKANKAQKKYLHLRLNMNDNALQMVDGSGLSVKNQISPAAMLTILNRFTPHYQLLKKTQGVHVKSGTLTGVYSYVGYFEENMSLSPFVLLLNQNKNNRKLLLKLMKNEFQQLHKK